MRRKSHELGGRIKGEMECTQSRLNLISQRRHDHTGYFIKLVVDLIYV